MEIIPLLVLSIISGIFYRIGGSDLKIPFKTKYRDLGVPLIGLVCLYVLVPFNATWAYWGTFLGFFILSFGSMTTYWDHWGTDDVEWYEWTLTGFCYGISALPVTIYTGRWVGYYVRTIILMLAIPYSNKLKYEWLVEPFRGFMFVITIPLLIL